MTKDEYVNHLKIFEGYATHMYLDTKGIVTIGIGIAFFSPTDAKKLMYMNRLTSKMATAEEIEADYKKVKAASPAYSAPYYKQFTQLDAVPSFLMGEFEKRLAEATAGAKAFYPAFDKLPSDVQYALIDMAYNLGAGGLAEYKNLKKALEAGDYETAAKESYRNGPGKDRNDKIAEWIRRGKLNTGDFIAPSSSSRYA